jgi:hypothetical protein
MYRIMCEYDGKIATYHVAKTAADAAAMLGAIGDWAHDTGHDVLLAGGRVTTINRKDEMILTFSVHTD